MLPTTHVLAIHGYASGRVYAYACMSIEQAYELLGIWEGTGAAYQIRDVDTYRIVDEGNA